MVDEVRVSVDVTTFARFSWVPDQPTQGETISFDASNSDVEGSTLTSYEWDFDDDGTTDATGQTASTSYSDDGTYPVSLTVTAVDGRTATTTKTVTVYNAFPAPAFTYTPSSPDPGESVSFDASGSSDPDGTISSYAWDFDDDGTTEATGQTATFSYPSAGDYTARLLVTDDDGATNGESKVISVASPSPPSVSITGTSVTGSGKSGKYDVDVTFQATDPDDDISNYTVLLYDSSAMNTELDRVIATPYDGSSTTVTVSDSDSNTGETPLYVVVRVGDTTDRVGTASKIVDDSNAAPTASFTYSPSDPETGESVSFDASGSTDPDGDALSYAWDFDGDGTTDATGKTASTTFGSTGSRSVELTVTDGNGGSDTETQTVTVSSGSGGPQQDPGFAYEDVNNDGLYSSADGDFQVDVSDGTYDAASNGSSLVVPDSVSAISASSVSLKGRSVTVETDVTSSGAATLEASTGTLDIGNQRVESNGGGQALTLSGDTISATGATVVSAGKLTTTAGSSMDFSSATVRSQGGGQVLKLSGGDLTATDATFTSAGKITVSSAPTMDLTRATIRSEGSGQELKLSGGDLTATDATLTSEGTVTVSLSGALDVDGATIESRGSGQEAKFDAASIRGVGATVDSAGSITATASSGAVTFTGATLDVVDGSNQGIALTSNGEMYVDNARLVGDEFSSFTGNRQNNGNMLYVGGAVFEDGSGRAKEFDISPGDRRGGGSKPPQNVDGTPQKGTVV
ncbi:PKD domain-containing protein [Haloarcula regularis]|uniref:PKD domain-containing protein n=1 Tax=Haloarcula regularis TaxID=3033392 RepID=UPI0023E7CCDD|nr:PKD domain-containing protein [Halomicroarcula sp. SYNS111]